jgi:FixJ family two-component response regulator
VTDQPEEVRRLVEAIEALEAIEDDAEAARAATAVLDEWPNYHAQLRELRQRRVLALKAKGQTWKQIADEALGGVHPTRAQQIATGKRGTKRPKADEAE